MPRYLTVHILLVHRKNSEEPTNFFPRDARSLKITTRFTTVDRARVWGQTRENGLLTQNKGKIGTLRENTLLKVPYNTRLKRLLLYQRRRLEVD